MTKYMVLGIYPTSSIVPVNLGSIIPSHTLILLEEIPSEGADTMNKLEIELEISRIDLNKGKNSESENKDLRSIYCLRAYCNQDIYPGQILEKLPESAFQTKNPLMFINFL